MECLTQKRAIKKTFSSVRSLSFNEKKEVMHDEKIINQFLDAINEFKKNTISRSENIESINEAIEKLTWYTDLDEECLMLINDLIAALKDLRSSLIRHYIKMNYLRTKGIAKNEIKMFKEAIDGVKEAYEDLESVFFFLPEIPEFKETTKQLSLVS